MNRKAPGVLVCIGMILVGATMVGGWDGVGIALVVIGVLMLIYIATTSDL